MFGPVIDISQIDAFAGTNPRYKTEFEIAESLKRLRQTRRRDLGENFVLDQTKAYLLDAKPARRLIDEQMCRLICKAAKEGHTIRIISSVPDESVFVTGRKVILKYVASLHSGTPGLTEENFDWCPAVEDENGHGVDATKDIRRYLTKRELGDKKRYTIVVDDSPPFCLTDEPELLRGVDYDDWISGTEIEPTEIYHHLGGLLDDRKRFKDVQQAVVDICQSNSAKAPLNLSDEYGAVSKFCVFDEGTRQSLQTQALSIKEVIAKENSGPPLCVFLGGPPGFGKSFFVEMCAEFLGAPNDYPATSLSGVGTDRFSDAIEHHIEMVYGKPTPLDSNIPMIALLDEVDTATSARESAFRLLMDAMTGSRTDKYGLNMNALKSGRVERLVWFFAGSAGSKREDFVQRFEEQDRKVDDFFDRFHFHLQLPGVGEAGQAIIQALTTLANAKVTTKVNTIEKNLLLFLGATRWTSARQVNTICRLAASKGTQKLRLADFEDLVEDSGELSFMFGAVDSVKPLKSEVLFLPN